MRKTGILEQTTKALWLPESGLQNRNWPLCQTCGRDVDAIEIVEDGVKMGYYYVVIRAKHHGAEDALKIEFLSRHPNKGDMDYALRVATFFDPTHNDAGFTTVK